MGPTHTVRPIEHQAHGQTAYRRATVAFAFQGLDAAAAKRYPPDAMGQLNAGLRRPARRTPDNYGLWPSHGCFSLYSPFRQRIDMLVASLRPS